MLALFLLMISSGLLMLVFSVIPIRKIFRKVGSGTVRSRWIVLTSLIGFFVIGYVSFATIRAGTDITVSDIVVSLIMMAGGAFVLGVASLSCETALDLERIAYLERDNVLDPLTKVFNRRYLDKQLKAETQKAYRYGLSLTLLMIDLDYFKQINDQHGHATGDLVLCRISKLIFQTARDSDIVARFGGEEFLIVAPCCSAEDAECLAERIRVAIAQERIFLSGSAYIQVTASIGVASLSGDENPEILLRRADMALYTAKREGRNRVHVEACRADL